MNVSMVVKNSVIPKYENIQTTHYYKKNQSHNDTDDHNFFFFFLERRALTKMIKVQTDQRWLSHIYLQIYEVTA